MPKLLITGGAGYVGSAVAARLVDRGHFVWVLDDLSTGFPEHFFGEGYTLAQVGDEDRVAALLARIPFDCVLHFAGLSLVAEGEREPERYRRVNVEQTRSLVRTLVRSAPRQGRARLLFSSSCSVYGPADGLSPIDESQSRQPVSVYGQTKLAVERILETAARDDGLRAVSLRYFNAAGAEAKLRVGERHVPETHLIPRVLAALRADSPIDVHGMDYPTPDRTCVRDYVHVEDLADAHEAAVERLLSGSAPGFEAFNVGSGHGYSVLEVIRAAENATGRSARLRPGPRRQGDPPFLVASTEHARRELALGSPPRPLEAIVESALGWSEKWDRRRPAIFLDRDGTLNPDPGYLRDPEDLRLLPGVGEALARLSRAGYALVVCTNQSGVARGIIRPEALESIHSRMSDLLAPFGARIDRYGACLHLPDAGCACRKPSPFLAIQAAQELSLELRRSYFVGDREADLGAGQAAFCRGVALVRTGSGRETEAAIRERGPRADFIGDDLGAVADWILQAGG